MDSQKNLKIADWKKKLATLKEVDLPSALKRLEEAAPTGDWEENVEYEDAERQGELIKVEIANIEQIIKKLSKGEK